MKPFLGIDITKNKNNETLNGQEFVAARVSAIRSDLLSRAVDDVEKQAEKTKTPRIIRVIRMISFFGMLVMTYGIISALGGEEKVTLPQAYQNAPAVFWIAAGCFALWLLISLVERNMEKKAAENVEADKALSKAEQIVKDSYQELGVPESAVNFDLLVFRYVEKKGKIVPQGIGSATFMAANCKIFTENGFLCFADAEQRFHLPMSAIRRIETVKKDAGIPTWNKDVPVNKPPYKQFKLRIDNYGVIHFKPYYILELELDGETWGVYFPSYELPIIESLTGHHPEV